MERRGMGLGFEVILSEMVIMMKHYADGAGAALIISPPIGPRTLGRASKP